MKSAHDQNVQDERVPGKQRAILDAAAALFLSAGYLATSVDEVAASAGVSKQTVYKHFGSKENLFLAVGRLMTREASERVQGSMREPVDAASLKSELIGFAERQLTIVLTPQLLRLRRLAIAEADRFPEFGKAVYEGGAAQAINSLASAFGRWSERGLLIAKDPVLAASQFNWLVMGEPINRAMFLGAEAAATAEEIRQQADRAVSTFLKAFSA